MYENYFGLKTKPFTIAPNPLYLYMSRQHREALAHLVFGVQSDNGFIVITGEVGTGKTTLCRCFLEQVPKETEVCLILNPRMNAIEMLASICDELHIEYPHSETSIKIYVDLINARLLNNYAESKKTLLIIDEAQNLSDSVLEQLRLLTNLETNDQKLLQIILIGQTELRERFEKRNLRQLAQRITARYHLTALTEKDVMEYVRHRLVVAGGRSHVFSDSAVKKIFYHTKGVPRLINTLCDRALLGAYATNQERVDASVVNRSARELLGQAKTTTSGWKLWLVPVLSMIFLVILFAGSLYFVEPLRARSQVLWQQWFSQIQSMWPEKDIISSAKVAVLETETKTAIIDQVAVDSTPKAKVEMAPEAKVEMLSEVVDKQVDESKIVDEPKAVDETKIVSDSKREDAPEEAMATPAVGTFDQFVEAFQSRRLMPNTEAVTWSELTQLYGVQYHGLSHENDILHESSMTNEASTAQMPWRDSEAGVKNRQNMPMLTDRFSNAEWKGRCTALPEFSPLSCVAVQGDLNLVGVLNTPVIIPLSEGGRPLAKTYFAVLSRMTLSQVYVSLGNQTYILPVGAFARYWSGEFLALAPVPKSFDRILTEGDENIEVQWVFARLNQWQGVSPNGLEAPIQFDRALQERVKLFQQAKGLVPDGLVGVHTFVLLSQVGQDFPVLHD